MTEFPSLLAYHRYADFKHLRDFSFPFHKGSLVLQDYNLLSAISESEKILNLNVKFSLIVYGAKFLPNSQLATWVLVQLRVAIRVCPLKV